MLLSPSHSQSHFACHILNIHLDYKTWPWGLRCLEGSVLDHSRPIRCVSVMDWLMCIVFFCPLLYWLLRLSEILNLSDRLTLEHTTFPFYNACTCTIVEFACLPSNNFSSFYLLFFISSFCPSFLTSVLFSFSFYFASSTQNGLRFISNKGEILDIMYGNIKHAIYQPCDKTTMVLVHFHLKVLILHSTPTQMAVLLKKPSFKILRHLQMLFLYTPISLHIFMFHSVFIYLLLPLCHRNL